MRECQADHQCSLMNSAMQSWNPNLDLPKSLPEQPYRNKSLRHILLRSSYALWQQHNFCQSAIASPRSDQHRYDWDIPYIGHIGFDWQVPIWYYRQGLPDSFVLRRQPYSLRSSQSLLAANLDLSIHQHREKKITYGNQLLIFVVQVKQLFIKNIKFFADRLF